MLASVASSGLQAVEKEGVVHDPFPLCLAERHESRGSFPTH